MVKFSRRELFDVDILEDENKIVTGAPEEYFFSPKDRAKVEKYLNEPIIEADNLIDARENYIDTKFPPKFLKKGLSYSPYY